MMRSLPSTLRVPVLCACLALRGGTLPMPDRAVQTFRLPNGLEVQLLENHDRPILRMELVARWDPSEVPEGRPGLPAFLCEVLGAAGAGPHTHAAFLRSLDDRGLRFSFTHGPQRLAWSLRADSRGQAAAFEHLAHAVLHPILDAPLVEAQRQRLIREAQVASPRDAAAARFLSSLGDAQAPAEAVDMEGVGFQELDRFLRRVLRPEHSRLALSGDLNLSQAKELAYLHLGAWGPSPEPPLALGPVARTPPVRLLAVPDGHTPLEIWIGAPWTEGPGADPALAELLAVVLEQAFQDRLLTPWASVAQEGPSEGRSAFLLKASGLDPAEASRGLEGLLGDLGRLQKTGLTAQALLQAKEAWRNRRSALGLHPGEMTRLLALDRLGLASAVDAVPLEVLNAALARRLAPESLRLLLMGFAPAFQEEAGRRLSPAP